MRLFAKAAYAFQGEKSWAEEIGRGEFQRTFTWSIQGAWQIRLLARLAKWVSTSISADRGRYADVPRRIEKSMDVVAGL